MDSIKVSFAMSYASYWHSIIEQKRKYTFDPYIVHPRNVVQLIIEYTTNPSEELLCAAWLHDIVEDTPCTFNDIYIYFGPKVTNLVEMVTDISRYSDGNRQTRKIIDKEHLSKASPEGQTLKLADLIDNTISIMKYDPKFSITYLNEKKELLKVLTKGNVNLYNMAMEIV